MKEKEEDTDLAAVGEDGGDTLLQTGRLAHDTDHVGHAAGVLQQVGIIRTLDNTTVSFSII